MDFERGVQFSQDNTDEPTESGYSETKQAQGIETKGADYKNLKKGRPVQQYSRKEKIVNAYQRTSLQLVHAMTCLSQVSINSSRQQEKILDEIRLFRSIQDELLQCLLLEHRGQLKKDATSKGVWDLIE